MGNRGNGSLRDRVANRDWTIVFATAPMNPYGYNVGHTFAYFVRGADTEEEAITRAREMHRIAAPKIRNNRPAKFVTGVTRWE